MAECGPLLLGICPAGFYLARSARKRGELVGVAQEEIKFVCKRSILKGAAVVLIPPGPGTEITLTSGDVLRSKIKL